MIRNRSSMRLFFPLSLHFHDWRKNQDSNKIEFSTNMARIRVRIMNQLNHTFTRNIKETADGFRSSSTHICSKSTFKISTKIILFKSKIFPRHLNCNESCKNIWIHVFLRNSSLRVWSPNFTNDFILRRL